MLLKHQQQGKQFTLETTFNMERQELNGVINIDPETELLNPVCQLKGIYFDYENSITRVSVIFHELHFKHVREFEFGRIEPNEPKTLLSEIISRITK